MKQTFCTDLSRCTTPISWESTGILQKINQRRPGEMQISDDGYDVLLLFGLLVIDLPLSLHSEMITGQLFG